MNTLAHQQQALLDALFAWPPDDAVLRLQSHALGVGSRPSRGLQVYQANGHMLAERALEAAYPVLVQMLGSASFAELARALWHAHPPIRGDIGRWGGELAQFIEGDPQLQDTPYLADVARVEWALHCCTTAPDAQTDLGTLAQLTTDDPSALTLQLASGCMAMRSKWPIGSMLLAHRDGTPTLQEVGHMLRAGVQQDVVVWRTGFVPQVRIAVQAEVELLSSLQRGQALEQALESAPELDFSYWLPMAVQSGLVLGASPLQFVSQEADT